MPLCLSVLVRANTIIASAFGPLVIQFLVPFKKYLSPFFSAWQRSAPASEPEPGSESE